MITNKKNRKFIFGLMIAFGLIIAFFVFQLVIEEKETGSGNLVLPPDLADNRQTKDRLEYSDTQNRNFNNSLPVSFQAEYISFQNYSLGIYLAEDYPRLESWVENGEIECDETPLESSQALRISKKEINGHKYCIGAASEGAAGSVYTEYAYTTVIDGRVYLVKFVARYPNCSNYPDEQNEACIKEREAFNLDNLVDVEIEVMKIN